MILDLQRPARSWMRFVLPASLVLNAFFIAFTAGQLLNKRGAFSTQGPPPLQGVGIELLLANAEKALPPADAVIFRRVMSADKPQYMPSALKLAQARHTLERQILTEPYDPQAVRQAFQSWQNGWNQLSDRLQGPLVEALGQVSHEGRRKLLDQRRGGQPLTQYVPPRAGE